MLFFKKKPKSCVGIDIGTSSVKVVQLRRGEEGRYKLETYGELQTYGYLERLNEPFPSKAKSPKVVESQIIEMTRKLIKEAGVSTKLAAISIPVFSSFISVVDLPPMSEKELSRALLFEAKRHIPIPLGEVRIDWKIVDKEEESKAAKGLPKGLGKKGLFKFRVLLIAVPKEVIARYLRIAEALDLKLLTLELESFSYTRSLIGSDKSTACVLDFGARSTSFIVVDRGFIQMSHGLDISGTELTKALSHSMGVDFRRAEMYKKERGLNHKDLGIEREAKDILLTFIDKVVLELERIIDSYQKKTGRKVSKLVLTGGSSTLVGLKKYLEEGLKIDVVVGNPWARLVYPPLLKSILEEIAPRFAVAIGLAMQES